MNQNHVSLCNVVTQRKSVFVGRFVTFTIKSGHLVTPPFTFCQQIYCQMTILNNIKCLTV